MKAKPGDSFPGQKLFYPFLSHDAQNVVPRKSLQSSQKDFGLIKRTLFFSQSKQHFQESIFPDVVVPSKRFKDAALLSRGYHVKFQFPVQYSMFEINISALPCRSNGLSKSAKSALMTINEKEINRMPYRRERRDCHYREIIPIGLRNQQDGRNQVEKQIEDVDGLPLLSMISFSNKWGMG